MTLTELVAKMRRHAGEEDAPGAIAAAEEAAALDPAGAGAAFVAILVELDGVDLSDDAGDLADEVWRTRSAIQRGLEACGLPAVPALRALAARRGTEAAKVASLVLVTLGVSATGR